MIKFIATKFSGVKVYERRNALVHAKTAVVDGVWSEGRLHKHGLLERM